MKLWDATFNVDTGCGIHKYELIIAAPDFDSAKSQILKWDNRYCDCENNVLFHTLHLHEITCDYPSVVKTFDRGVIK